MSMTCRRMALRLLARSESIGVNEELIGDLMEEMSGGRSLLWMLRQMVGLYSLAAAARVRRIRPRPPAIALGLSALLISAAAMGFAAGMLEAWLLFYYAAGMASLFAHMAASHSHAPQDTIH